MEPSQKTTEKVTRKLVKREYLGEGYLHLFIHNQTGEEKFVECTEAEYKRMGLKGGSKYNPTLEGYTWKCSVGGTIKVNTPNTILGENEYCIKDGKVVAHLPDSEDRLQQFDIVDVVEDELEEAKIKKTNGNSLR